MVDHAPLLVTVSVGLVAAFALGFAASKARLSPIVGYVAAGLLIGPYTPGFVADVDLASQLAEIGVILLMFGVGLHFSIGELWEVRRVALPGAVVQMAAATALGTGLGLILGWGLGGSVIFGVALSVASTVVMLRALEEHRLTDARPGHIAIGWLVVEDLAMVIALVVVPVLADGDEGAAGLAAALALTVVKVAAFATIMLLIGKRIIPWALARTADTGSQELFTLGVLAIGLGVAVGAAWLFGVSFALGAFFAGMVLRESDLAHRAAEDSLPLRDAFAVLFFLSVGMLVDPRIVVEQPVAFVATVAIIVVGKLAVAYVLVRLLRYSSTTALTVAASLAQVGEFSFILVALGGDLGLLNEDARSLVLGGALASIIINPFLFAWAARRLHTHESVETADAPRTSTANGHVIVVGYGRVGARVARSLWERGRDVVVVDADEGRIDEIRKAGHEAILGSAARPGVLESAGVTDAAAIVVAIPDPLHAGAVVALGRHATAGATIVARGHRDADVDYLSQQGASRVLVGVHEVADLMVATVDGPTPSPS